MHHREGRSLSEDINWAADMARRMTDVDLVVYGETDDEEAASFVAAMLEAGFAEKL